MAKKKKAAAAKAQQPKVVKAAEKPRPQTKKVAGSAKRSSIGLMNPGGLLVFRKENYLIMAVGFAVVLLGFALMIGGATDDPNVFPADEIYSFRRITLAPILVLTGFAIEIYAIFFRKGDPVPNEAA